MYENNHHFSSLMLVSKLQLTNAFLICLWINSNHKYWAFFKFWYKPYYSDSIFKVDLICSFIRNYMKFIIWIQMLYVFVLCIVLVTCVSIFLGQGQLTVVALLMNCNSHTKMELKFYIRCCSITVQQLASCTSWNTLSIFVINYM